jgi:DNA-binding CsgD family transcriptional regulator
MLVGRERETRRLTALLAAARGGRGSALILRGEPGIGKSALLDEMRGRAADEGFRVLHTRGLESEATLSFAGLADLLAPILEHLDHIPRPRAAALRGALALGPPSGTDRFAAYAATLSLLGAASSARPILIVVDDAHWIDTPTAEALLFCARRIEDDPVVMIGASREVAPERLDFTGIDEMVIGPLDEAASRVLAATAGAAAGGPLAERVVRLARGNPLSLIELPRILGPEDPQDGVPVREPHRVSDPMRAALGRRVGRLTPAGRRALLTAAVSGGEDLAPVLDALGRQGGAGSDLTEAEEAGVIDLDGLTFRFRHPLMRAVTIDSATPRDRRAAHIALAEAFSERSDPERGVWHLAAGSVGPDESVARAMEDAAERATARTAYMAAAAALERASRFSPRPADAARRLSQAAASCQMGGAPAEALSLLERARLQAPDDRTRLEMAHRHGVTLGWMGHVDAGFASLLELAAEAQERFPDLAAQMLADAVVNASLAGRCREALATAQRAALLAGPASPSPIIGGFLAWALILRGRRRQALPLLARADAQLVDVPPLSPEGRLRTLLCLPRAWSGDLDTAEAWLDRVVSAGRAAGAVAALCLPLDLQAEMHLRRGRFALAVAAEGEAISAMRETGQTSSSGHSLGCRAIAEAILGRSGDARRDAADAMAAGERTGERSALVYGQAAIALVHLGDRKPEAACAALEPVTAFYEENGIEEPALVMWPPDLVEARAMAGDLDGARTALGWLAARAYAGGGAWARAATCRGRGLIDDAIDRHFGEALALHEPQGRPFERARTRLAYGERLLRAGRRTDARVQLERALSGFDDLGADPWARRARDELAATGARARSRRPAPSGELSARELQVAESVAAGLTNRETAARLFLSEKTIERHLGSIYRKLGLRSRTELAARMASPEAPHAADL